MINHHAYDATVSVMNHVWVTSNGNVKWRPPTMKIKLQCNDVIVEVECPFWMRKRVAKDLNKTIELLYDNEMTKMGAAEDDI